MSFVQRRRKRAGCLLVEAASIFVYPPPMSIFGKPPKSQPASSSAITNQRLDELIRIISPDVTGQLGYWQFNIRGRDLLVITDETHNRMRIMAPVAPQSELDEDEFIRLLEANYDRALDPKYALKDGALWAVYTHPLAELTDDQFTDSINQTATLADNFGTSYASSNLFFGGR